MAFKKKADLQQGLGKLKDDVDKIRSHTSDLVSDIGGAVKGGVEMAKDNILASGKKAAENLVEGGKKYAKNAEKAMEKNPMKTVAGAVGLGVIIGGLARRLIARKKRR